MNNLIEYKLQNIYVISDTHGKHRQLIIPENIDIIIHCGDICRDGNIIEIQDFFDWYSLLKIPNKIFVHGNHDLPFDLEPELGETLISENVIWLNDAFISIGELNILGINGFVNDYEIVDNLKFDFVISHYPPKGILDNNFGSPIIRKIVDELQPTYHFFGHNHEDYGTKQINKTTYCNTSVFHKLF